jgi:ferredoxin
MFYDPDTRKAFKCNLCGGAPACAEACPTAAITYEDTATADWLGDFAAGRVQHAMALEGEAVLRTSRHNDRSLERR